MSDTEDRPVIDDRVRLYEYASTVVRWVDGDTIDLDVDLGHGVHIFERYRLHRINAWEKRGAEREKGLAALEYVDTRYPVGSSLYLRTKKDKKGKYGRYLADLYVDAEEGGLLCINDILVEEGHARYQDY